MSVTIQFSSPKNKLDKKSVDTLVVPVYLDNRLSAGASEIDQAGDGFISRFLKDHAEFKGKLGQTMVLPAPKGRGFGRVVLIGFEKPGAWDAQACETIGGRLGAALAGAGAVSCAVMLGDEDCAEQMDLGAVAAHMAAGIVLRAYKFDKYKSKEAGAAKPRQLERVQFITREDARARKLFAALKSTAESVFFARDLVNEPPNVLYPDSFAKRIRATLAPLGVEVEIFDEKKLEKLGFGAHLAVGMGSERKPRLVVMHWRGGAVKDKAGAKAKKLPAPVALVGKGITFDTGGISIKPAAGMDEMKMDMGGAAAVVGAMRAIAARKSKAHVVGVVALAENMPSHNAYRPGDIITSLSGKTIEVLNTDAEGRLVLCDALTYVQRSYKPRAIIDLATLTGAIMVALGHEYTGTFANDDTLWQNIDQAGRAAGEKYWRMPLDEAYRKEMDSPVADLRNLGNMGRYGGACSAAGFLERFIEGKTAWAHLDIAGTAWVKTDRATVPRFASGVGVRMLDRLVADFYE